MYKSGLCLYLVRSEDRGYRSWWHTLQPWAQLCRQWEFSSDWWNAADDLEALTGLVGPVVYVNMMNSLPDSDTICRVGRHCTGWVVTVTGRESIEDIEATVRQLRGTLVRPGIIVKHQLDNTVDVDYLRKLFLILFSHRVHYLPTLTRDSGDCQYIVSELLEMPAAPQLLIERERLQLYMQDLQWHCPFPATIGVIDNGFVPCIYRECEEILRGSVEEILVGAKASNSTCAGCNYTVPYMLRVGRVRNDNEVAWKPE